MRTIVSFFLLLVGLTLGSVTAYSQVVPNEYVLGSGDKLKISVFGEPDLSGDYEVDGRGYLSISLIGDLKAAGLTVPVFVKTLTTQLSQYLKNPRVSAEVTNYRPFYILGEVKTPGSYPYVNDMSVIKAVALAGGFTYRANEDEVTIKRGGSEAVFPADDATKIAPGDTIVVKERFF